MHTLAVSPWTALRPLNDVWRIVRMIMMVTVLVTAWRGGQCVAGIAEDDEIRAAFVPATGADSDRLIRVEWAMSGGAAARSRISGYVYNQSAQTASNVQLRIGAVGTAGEAISSVSGLVIDSVPGQGRVRFDVQVPGIGTSYDVAVTSFSFDFSAKP